MAGPARAGVLVYAKNLSRLSTFYCAVLGGVVRAADHEHHVIATADLQIVVHAIPAVIAEKGRGAGHGQEGADFDGIGGVDEADAR